MKDFPKLNCSGGTTIQDPRTNYIYSKENLHESSLKVWNTFKKKGRLSMNTVDQSFNLFWFLNLLRNIFFSNFHVCQCLILLQNNGKHWHNRTNIYLLKVNNRNSKKRYEICSKLTINHQNNENRTFWCFYC